MKLESQVNRQQVPRHIMVMSYGDSVLQLLFDTEVVNLHGCHVVFSSEFPVDLTTGRELSVYTDLNIVKRCIEFGQTVILLGNSITDFLCKCVCF